MILYFLFIFLYTLYIISHHAAGHSAWAYYFKFLLVSGYLFFILQGLVLRSKNWGILLLLPLALLAVTVIVGFVIVWILRLGGGTLLDRDDTDMILATFCWVIGSFYALKLIKTGKNGRKRNGRKKLPVRD
jgi:hypothetical protein